MEEFVINQGLRIELSPLFSPWSSGISERNHYSADVIVKKIMADNAKVVLQDAVNMASRTHNTNLMVSGYTPM